MSRPDTCTVASGMPMARRAANPCRMRDSGADDRSYEMSRVIIVNKQFSTIASPNRRRGPATNSSRFYGRVAHSKCRRLQVSSSKLPARRLSDSMMPVIILGQTWESNGTETKARVPSYSTHGIIWHSERHVRGGSLFPK